MTTIGYDYQQDDESVRVLNDDVDGVCAVYATKDGLTFTRYAEVTVQADDIRIGLWGSEMEAYVNRASQVGWGNQWADFYSMALDHARRGNGVDRTYRYADYKIE